VVSIELPVNPVHVHEVCELIRTYSAEEFHAERRKDVEQQEEQ